MTKFEEDRMAQLEYAVDRLTKDVQYWHQAWMGLTKMTEQAMEILKEGGSDIQNTNIIVAARVVIGDLKSVMSGRDFYKRECERYEKSGNSSDASGK